MLFRIIFQWIQRRRRRAAGLPDPEPDAGGQPSIEHGARAMKLEVSNVVAIARREYISRFRTRTFRATTVLLFLAAIGVSAAPIAIGWLDRQSGPTVVEVSNTDPTPTVDVQAALGKLLNPPATGTAASQSKAPDYTVRSATDVAAARARVESGDSAGLLLVSRPTAGGDLAFTFVTKARAVDRIAGLMQGAASSLTALDRLARLGIRATQVASLSAPPTYSTEGPNGTKNTADTPENFLNGFATGFVLSIVLFMAIILYGQWVAYSVAEEKSSRVMEVILGAASPFELLAGKVVGVGSLAITQYVIIFLPAAAIVLLQDPLSSIVLGEPASAAALPQGLSIGLLLTFGVLFVLGFALYAVLYAGAAALVSRTEDINAIVAPMTLVSTAGYLVAVYSATGLIAPDSKLVTVMSYIPFFSPYLVLSRMSSGQMTAVEVIISILILAASVPVAMWVAARFYAAGVLLYGQRPSIRLFTRVLRGG